jgi:hypothetical protein
MGPAIIIGLLLAAAPASAAPATVKVFEGSARERPDLTAPVLKTFPEDTELSVSEEVTDGWRRVRLPDGGVGYMRDQELELAGASAASAGAAKPVVRQRADEEHRATPLIYIKDLSHLAEVVSRDDEVHRMATDLTTRQTAAIGVVSGGLAVGTLLVVGAMTIFTHPSCTVFTSGGPNGPTSDQFCVDRTNQAMLYGGTGVVLASGLVAALLWPKRNDLLDVINAWNRRHILNPISVNRGVAAHDE